MIIKKKIIVFLLKIRDIDETVAEVGALSLIIGFLTSLVISYFAVNVLLELVEKQKFHYFTPYCLIVGSALIIDSLF